MDPLSRQDAWLCAWILALTTWAGSSDAMRVVQLRYPQKGAVLNTLIQTAHLGDLLAITGFGFLFCAFHHEVIPQSALRTPTAVEWGVITLGIGTVLGGLFTVFLGKEDEGANTLLPLVGIITFAAGAAFFLDLSALLVNLVLGVVLVNTAQQGVNVRQTLMRTVRPISLILLVFAGALWTPPPLWPTVILSGGLIVLRLLGKVLFLWIATLGTSMRKDVFRGLIGQGHVAVAMALSTKLVFHGTGIDIVYTSILVSVVVHELVAPHAKGLLVDSGLIRHEVKAEG